MNMLVPCKCKTGTSCIQCAHRRTCHPGPCPPCQVALVVPCPSHHTGLTVKCAVASSNNAALTPVCDEICGRERNCGNTDHACEVSRGVEQEEIQLTAATLPFWSMFYLYGARDCQVLLWGGDQGGRVRVEPKGGEAMYDAELGRRGGKLDWKVLLRAQLCRRLRLRCSSLRTG